MARDTHSWVVTGAIGTAPATQSGKVRLRKCSTPRHSSAPQAIGRRGTTKCIWCPSENILPFPRLFAFAGGLTKEVGEFEPGDVACAAGCRRRTARNLHLLRVGVSRRSAAVCRSGRAGFRESFERRLVWRQRRVRPASESDAHARHRERPLDPERDEHWSDGFDRSLRANGGAAPRKERAALVAPYALTSVTTFYTRHGDWFAWLCAIISAGALVTRFAFSGEGRKTPNESRVRTGIRIAEQESARTPGVSLTRTSSVRN